MTIKNSINVFTNKLTQPNYFFGGRQSGSYTEIAYNINRKKNNWVIGSNIWTDAFTEERPLPVNIRDYHLFTAGGFIQNNFTVTDHIIIETGLRADLNQLKNSYHNSKNYTFLLPRLSALFVLNNHYSARLTGGLGYKMPAIFNEEAEMASYKNVRTINADKVKPELSEGISADLYYKARVGKVSINFNQLFFYTIVKKPLIFDRALAMQSIYEYINAPSLMDTKGFESQVKMRWKELVFFGGYTFQETRRKYLANTPLPFAPKHRLLMTLMYDKEEHVKMGFESSYTGSQHLTDGRIVRSYWTAGFSAEKIWKHFSLYVNFENFTNA
ncbi:MAG: TonB-dependent receptor [Segetibacter sp.]